MEAPTELCLPSHVTPGGCDHAEGGREQWSHNHPQLMIRRAIRVCRCHTDEATRSFACEGAIQAARITRA